MLIKSTSALRAFPGIVTPKVPRNTMCSVDVVKCIAAAGRCTIKDRTQISMKNLPLLTTKIPNTSVQISDAAREKDLIQIFRKSSLVNVVKNSAKDFQIHEGFGSVHNMF